MTGLAHIPPAQDPATAGMAPVQGALRERALVVLAVSGLIALGAGFWFVNGTRTFGELMLGAFSWCF